MKSKDMALIEKVCKIYEKISNLKDLNPSDEVNSLFTELVLTCTPPCSIDVTRLSKEVQEIRQSLIKICGEAEGLLESHFSTLLGSYESPLDHIDVFPYYSNYLKLSHLEFTMLRKCCTQVPNQVAFVGSGPLPLTSIILATQYFKTTCFHNIDIDPLANSKALHLVSSDPDLSKRMLFHNIDVMNLSNELQEYDVVFLAALAGMTKEKKRDIVNHLAKNMAPGAFLLLRSAHGARAFLYPVVDLCDLNQGFEVLSVFHPTDEVINSIIIARKKPVLSMNQGLLSTILPNKCSEVQGFSLKDHKTRIEEFVIDERLS